MKTNFPKTTLCLNGFPKLVVDSREIPAVAYTSYFPKVTYYKQIAEQGLRLFCFPAYLANRGINIHSGIGPFRKGLWKDPSVFDFSDLIEDFDKILTAADDALVIMRLHLDVPTWWEKKYPDHCCMLNDGTTLRQSFSSNQWVEDTNDALKTILAWLNDSPYAKHLAGIHMAAGGTEEWVYHYFDRFEDNCKDRTAAYCKWILDTYGLEDAQAVPANINPGAAMDRHTQDTLRFHAAQLAERIGDFCKTVKEQTQGHLLTGAFYGYHHFVFDPRKGHNALAKLLQCRDLDYLASPNVYDRQPGRDWPPMAAVDSIKLHGKLWMAEHDTRTCLTKPLKETAPAICPEGAYADGVWIGPESQFVSQMLLRNNTARMLTHQYGGWWFDMWGGWFSDPDFLAEIKRAQELTALKPSQDPDYPQPQVCVITDEELSFYDPSFGNLACEILYQPQRLAKTGCPYRAYLRSDLERIAFDSFQFIWLLGCPNLSSKEWQFVSRLHDDAKGILHTDLTQSRFLAPSAKVWQPACTFTDWSPERLYELYKDCGVHRYLDTQDIVYLGNGFLTIHAASAGPKKITLPAQYTVTDVVSHKTLCSQAERFCVDLKQYETLLLKLS